jgi:hypothetical protein
MSYNVDPERPVDDILADIKVGARDSFQTPMGNSDPGKLFAPFAALLVRLSRDAEATARRAEATARRLERLTIAILVFTVLLLAKEGFDIYEKHQEGQHLIEPKIESTRFDAPG